MSYDQQDARAIDRIVPDREHSDTVTKLEPESTVDNARIQAVLDKAGIVEIPAGNYTIDCSKPLRPKSNTLIRFLPGAILKALPHGMQRSQMILVQNVDNVQIKGGRFIGERDKHDFSDTSGTGTHEWNHCLANYGGNACTYEDMDISDFTGDAISVGRGSRAANVGSYDVVFNKIIGDNNYRQGLSLVCCTKVRVYDCQFTGTNGTSPECGIDIEPELNQVANDIQIVGGYFGKNHKYGINILARDGASNPGGTIRGVLVAEVTVEVNDSNGFYAHNARGLVVETSRFLTNSATGAIFSRCPDYIYRNNQSGFNYARSPLSQPRTPFTQTGWTSKIQRDVLLKNDSPTTGCKTNRYL